MNDLLILYKSYLYKITIIALVLFIPLNVFADDFKSCTSLIDNDGDNVPENIPYFHNDFSYCDLIGITLNDRDLIDADFEGANLSGAKLTGSNLENANFNNAIMYGTDLKSANLENASFKNAILNLSLIHI